MEKKKCNGPCGEEKHITKFYINKSGRIHSKCKECEKAYQAEYREKNKEKLKAERKKNYEENKDEILERNRKNRENNKESIRESNRKSAKKRRPKIKGRLEKLFEETPEDTTKICSACCEEKFVTEFYKGSGKYGRRSQCILCYNEKVAEYREENIEEVHKRQKEHYQKHKEKKKQYAEENKEHINAYQVVYREKNKERIRKQRKEYREENKEKIKVAKKKHYEENKETILAKRRQHRLENPHLEVNKRARRLSKIEDALEITKKDWLNIMKSANWRCFYCDVELTKENRSVDHVVPLALSGVHEPFNLVPSCISCNSSKGDKKLKDWGAFYKLVESKQKHLIYIESSYERN